MKIGTEEVKLSLFVDGEALLIESSREITEIAIEFMNEFSKVKGVQCFYVLTTNYRKDKLRKQSLQLY